MYPILIHVETFNFTLIQMSILMHILVSHLENPACGQWSVN